MPSHESSSDRVPSDFVTVRGIWLRKIGDDVQVLADVLGSWRLVIVEPLDGNFSHIVEPPGIRDAPADPLEAE